MRGLRWPLLILAICLPVAWLLSGAKLPWLSDSPAKATPVPVPSGDQEIAWIHTTTNATTWERFVTGVMRVPMAMPDVEVDDRNAFLDSTTAVPELVLSRKGATGKLRIRWYKLQNSVTTADWIQALARRSPPPLAVIGGGSTDRAVQLAQAMGSQESWRGDRPPLLITTATADFSENDELLAKTRLVDVYDDRTFRFCFSNGQMAEAVIDFARQSAELNLNPHSPTVLSAYWADDRFSVDLQDQFTEALKKPPGANFAGKWGIPFSIGGFTAPNVYEANAAESIAKQIRERPEDRVLLVLPAIVQPARRLLRAIVEADPLAAQKLVVVTGDGIPINAILRDGEFAWPIGALPVPLVLFAHNDPTAWDRPGAEIAPPPGYALSAPNGTEEAMHFNEMARVLVEACYPPNAPLLNRPDELIARLTSRRPSFFDTNGERLGGTGEHVVVLLPGSQPKMLTYRRGSNRTWERVSEVPLSKGKPGGVRP